MQVITRELSARFGQIPGKSHKQQLVSNGHEIVQNEAWK